MSNSNSTNNKPVAEVMDKTKLNTSEVARRTGKGRATITRHADKGKISFELDDNGHRLFDASEVDRVYRKDVEKVAIGQMKTGTTSSEQTPVALKLAEDKLIVQYEDRIAYLEKTLEKALDITPLLEDRSSEKKQWETLLDSKMKEFANQTEQRMADQAEKQQEEANKWKHRYFQEANKSWLDKLLEKKKRVGASKRK